MQSLVTQVQNQITFVDGCYVSCAHSLDHMTNSVFLSSKDTRTIWLWLAHISVAFPIPITHIWNISHFLLLQWPFIQATSPLSYNWLLIWKHIATISSTLSMCMLYLLTHHLTHHSFALTFMEINTSDIAPTGSALCSSHPWFTLVRIEHSCIFSACL